MTPSFRALGAAILMIAWAGAANAQQQKPAPTAAAVQMAREIIQLKGATTTFDPLITGVIEYHRNVMIQTNPNLSREIQEVASKLINELQGRRIELQQALATSMRSISPSRNCATPSPSIVRHSARNSSPRSRRRWKRP
jgi:hypothetical protein